jgi:hypothetical protein
MTIYARAAARRRVRRMRLAALLLFGATIVACTSPAASSPTPEPSASAATSPKPSASAKAKTAVELLDDAVGSTIAAGTVSMQMSIGFEGGNMMPPGMVMTADGTFAFGPRRRIAIAMDMGGVGMGAAQLQMIVDEPDMWLRFQGDEMGDLFPADKWVHVGAASTGMFAEMFRAFLSGPNDTSLMVYYLLGSVGNGVVVGKETVDGVALTHVRTRLDLDLALDRVPAEVRDALVINIDEIRSQGLEPTIDAEAWIADDGLIHRQRLEYSLGAIQGGGAMVLDMTMALHGEPLALPIPSFLDTVEAETLEFPEPVT